MKHTLRQVFHSGKFVAGFCILVALLLLIAIYPLFVKGDPLAIIGQGTFFPPGIYVNSYDSIDKPSPYILNLPDAAAKRIVSKLSESDRQEMKDWLLASGIPENEIDTTDTAKLMEQWETNYDPTKGLGMTYAKQRYYQRLDKSISGLLSPEGKIIAAQNPDTGILEQVGVINQSDYVNVGEVANVRVLMLGTDNFGRDMLTQLVKAIGVSLQIGIVAGLVATAIGLTLGLLSGYIGGWVDDVVMFFTNLFTVIPSFVLLVLISFSIGQDKRGATTIAIVIGLTSWVWTTRSVRASTDPVTSWNSPFPDPTVPHSSRKV